MQRSYHVKKPNIFLKTLYSFLCWKFLKFDEFLVQNAYLSFLMIWMTYAPSFLYEGLKEVYRYREEGMGITL